MNRLEVLSSAPGASPRRRRRQGAGNDIKNDQRLELHAHRRRSITTSRPIRRARRIRGIFVAIIMAIGSSFAAMNTMYAAVARRAREIGTLRVLGFSRGSILVSFFLESVLLRALGGVLGCLLVLPLNGYTSGIGNPLFAKPPSPSASRPRSWLMASAFAIVLGAWAASSRRAIGGAKGDSHRLAGV